MRIWRSSLAGGAFVLCACGIAAGQDTGKVGVTMGFPGSIGVIWQAADRVAIRPEFSFSRNTTEGTIDTTSWTLGTGVSGLFYVAKYDRVRTYVSPRYTYTRAGATAQLSSLADTTVTGWSATGSFGAQYSPSAKFGMFGEVGYGYSRQTTSPGIGSVDLTGKNSGTRAGVGVIFYP
jgi:hypothetical protein